MNYVQAAMEIKCRVQKKPGACWISHGNLVEANTQAAAALSKVAGFDGNQVTLLEIAGELAKTCNILLSVMTDQTKMSKTNKISTHK